MKDLTQRGTLPAGTQIRAYPAKFEVRALAGNKVELTGYASTTETPYAMYDMFGEYEEVVRSGAFTKTLSDGADVAYLANHGGLTMARTKNGTLHLSEDSTGLNTVATLNVARSDARDLVTAVEDGDVDEMSFAFQVVRQQWSPDWMERALVELNLNRGDVSAVNYGANPTTSVGVQRAFRHQGAATLQRIATEIRESASPWAENVAQLVETLALSQDSATRMTSIIEEIVAPGAPAVDDDAVARAAEALETLRRADAHARDLRAS